MIHIGPDSTVIPQRGRGRRILGVVTAGVLLAACAAPSTPATSGSTPSSTSSNPTATASASPSTTSPSPSPTASEAAEMSAARLGVALLRVASVSGGSFKSGWADEWPDTNSVAGLDDGLILVSGSAACRQLIDGHPVAPRTDAGEWLRSSNLNFTESLESFSTVAEAEQVMAENVSQLKSCTRFVATMGDDKKHYTWVHHRLVVVTKGGKPTAVMHSLRSTDGSYVIVLHEVRLGGEIMFAEVNPRTSKGDAQGPKILVAAEKRFRSVVTAYRANHPRAV